MIVAPINLGAKVYSQAEAYQLAAVVTWGNLYVVGSQDKAWEDPNNKMALFGENAVPGLVYNDVLADQVKAQTTWYNAVSMLSKRFYRIKRISFFLRSQPLPRRFRKPKKMEKS